MDDQLSKDASFWFSFQSFGYVSKTRAGVLPCVSWLWQSLWQSWPRWQLRACCPCPAGAPFPLHIPAPTLWGKKQMLHLEPEAPWGTQPLSARLNLSLWALRRCLCWIPFHSAPEWHTWVWRCLQAIRSGTVGQRFPIPVSQAELAELIYCSDWTSWRLSCACRQCQLSSGRAGAALRSSVLLEDK